MIKYFIPVFLSLHVLVSKAQNFTIIDTLPTGAYGTAAWGDFNNDGFKDLAYLSQVLPDAACYVYINQNNVFSRVPQHFPYLFNPAAKWADLDNDGFDDLIVCGMDSLLVESTFIYRSLGNGTFIPQVHSIPGLAGGSIDVSDYNNDGLKDVAICGYGSSSLTETFIFRNNGAFSFTDIAMPLQGMSGGELKWYDYDRDGLPDLTTNGSGQNTARIRFYRNMNNDTFMEESFNFTGSIGTLDWIDYDLDGIKDLFITGIDSSFVNIISAMYHNDGNRNFTYTPVNIPAFGEPSAVSVGDFNNDSITDLCVIGGNALFNSYSTLATGQGNTTFNFHPLPAAVIDNLFTDAADIDNDGDIDLVLSTYILRNDGVVSGVNTEKTDPGSFILFPNPSSTILYVRSEKDIRSITVFDSTGRKLFRTEAGSENSAIPVQDLPSGRYLVRVMMEDGTSGRKNFDVIR